MLLDFPPSGTLGVFGRVLVLPQNPTTSLKMSPSLGRNLLVVLNDEIPVLRGEFRQEDLWVKYPGWVVLGFEVGHMYLICVNFGYLPQLWPGDHLDERDGNHEFLEKA